MSEIETTARARQAAKDARRASKHLRERTVDRATPLPINQPQPQETTMSEIETTASKVQEAKDALIASNKAHADAKRRAQAVKHVSEMSPAEIKAETRRRNLRNY
jgi:hypothetical protein